MVGFLARRRRMRPPVPIAPYASRRLAVRNTARRRRSTGLQGREQASPGHRPARASATEAGRTPRVIRHPFVNTLPFAAKGRAGVGMFPSGYRLTGLTTKQGRLSG